MTTRMQGTIHGKTIELSEDSGLVDGCLVAIEMRPIAKPAEDNSGIYTSAGAFADWPEADACLGSA